MNSKYKTVQELIDCYADFEAQQPSGNFSNFGEWLMKKEKNTSVVLLPGGSSHLSSEHSEFYKEMDKPRQFLTLLSRSARFIDFYMKKAFENSGIGSRIEFQFLISIFEMEQPRKTDIIYFNMVEISTGVETLKRLIRNGLVLEVADKTDKRSKRVKLTSNGEQVLNNALEKFTYLDQLTSTFGNNNWENFIPELMRFNELHNDIYSKHKEKPFLEIMEILNIK